MQLVERIPSGLLDGLPWTRRPRASCVGDQRVLELAWKEHRAPAPGRRSSEAGAEAERSVEETRLSHAQAGEPEETHTDRARVRWRRHGRSSKP